MAMTVADENDQNRHSADIQDKPGELAFLVPGNVHGTGRQHVWAVHESGQDDYASCPDDE
jgi:hypothetical protein